MPCLHGPGQWMVSAQSHRVGPGFCDTSGLVWESQILSYIDAATWLPGL